MEFLGITIMVVAIILASTYARVMLHKAGVKGHSRKGHVVVEASDGGAQHIIELEKLKIQERKEARAQVERLIQAKLEVINNAIAMGASDKELERLDARLEKLVGEERLKSLLEGKDLDTHDPELLDVNLEAEVQRIRQADS